MENNKRPRRDSGRGILDVHPTSLRRGNVSDIKPEQLHIIEIDPKQRVNVVKRKEEEIRRAKQQANDSKIKVRTQDMKTREPSTKTEENAVYSQRGTESGTAQAKRKQVVKTEFIKNTGLASDEKKNGAKTVISPSADSRRTSEMTLASSVKVRSASNDDVLHNSDGRSGKEQKARVLVNSLLCGTFAFFLLAGMLLSAVHMADEDKPVYSEYEKRPLEQMPVLTLSSLSDGSYTHGIDSFFSDNFPMRESLVKNATLLKRFRGVRAFDKNAKQVIHGDMDIYSDGEMEIIIDEDRFNNAEEIIIPGLDNAFGEQTSQGIEGEIPDDEGMDTSETEEMMGASFDPSQGLQITDTDTDNVGSDGSGHPVTPDGEGSTNGAIGGDETDVSESAVVPGEASSEIAAGELKGDKRDTIYIIGDTAYEYFRGTPKSADDYIKVINTYAKYIPENVNIYTLVIPTHPEFGLSGIDRTVSNDQKPVLDHIGKNLDARVKFANPHAKLLEAYNNGEYIYYRTDHHWTIRGAYCAYLEFCETAGITPIDSDSYEKGRVEPFLGTFYSASGREQSLADNPDYVEYFVIDTPCTVTRYDKNDKPSIGKLFYRSVRGESNGYLAFMGGDFPYAHIKTENTNGRKLMIFKESFANPLIGLLAPHFEEIHIADIRYFKYNSVNFIKQYGVTDVLFCNGIMSANSKARVNDLMELLNQ